MPRLRHYTFALRKAPLCHSHQFAKLSRSTAHLATSRCGIHRLRGLDFSPTAGAIGQPNLLPLDRLLTHQTLVLAPLQRPAVGVPVAKAAGFHPAAEAVQVETQRRMEVSGLMANVEAMVATQKLRLLASRAEQLHTAKPSCSALMADRISMVCTAASTMTKCSSTPSTCS